ncbi:MAG TPA: ABC transporter substrate-binding protein [Yinghuangia sp.]|nr:ABC transporter substrate-binding protein [Yinghuangia sp.]
MCVALAVALALAVGGCAAFSSGGGSDDSVDVRTGPGITDRTITLGAITDLTGVYATLGKSMTQAQQLYFDQLNDAGGVCGRDVELLIRDHGYDVQRGVDAYAEVSGKVAGLPQVIGSPIVSALLPNVQRDQMLTIPAAWASTLLAHRYIQVVGGTYDIEMINAVGFLVKEKGLRSGDKIGHVYFEGEYGESALSGAKFAAGRAGVTVVEQRIKATDAEMAPQVAALRAAGVKAILMSAGPKQSASLSTVAEAVGLNVPIVSNNPGFSPQLLSSPAASSLLSNFYLVSAVQTASAAVSGMRSLVAAYEEEYPTSPFDSAVSFGYVAAQVFGAALKKACEAKDLSREGILLALRTMKSFESGGIMPPLDFSKPGDAGSATSFVQRPHPTAKGGLISIGEPITAEGVEDYRFPSPG